MFCYREAAKKSYFLNGRAIKENKTFFEEKKNTNNSLMYQTNKYLH